MTIQRTTQFKKDFKKVLKRHKDENKLVNIIRDLIASKKLPQKNRDHSLSGDYSNCRECHIEPDWLLIYRIENQKELILIRTGSHSDLF